MAITVVLGGLEAHLTNGQEGAAEMVDL